MKPDLDAAIVSVEALAARGSLPTRHHARPVLIQIGECLLAGEEAEVRAARERLSGFSTDWREAWRKAVEDELSMACTEHIRSVDPRYLRHPDYDFAYTIEARRTLEARLRAAEYLGLPPDPALLDGVLRADNRLDSRRQARS